MKIFKIGLISLSCIAIMELMLWLFFPIPYEYNTALNLAKQNIRGCKNVVLYESNMFGFRALSMKTKEKPANTVRIICLGASTVDSASQSTEDTWSGILEKKLQNSFDSTGLKIEVAARGPGANTILGTYYWAQKELLDFQPDVVILLHGINDLCWRGGPSYNYNGIAEFMYDKKPDVRKSMKEVLKIW